MATTRPDTATPTSSNTNKKNKKCGTCKAVVKKEDNGLLCEYCAFWFHGNCEGVNQARYEAISSSGEQTHWFCTQCNMKVMDTLRFIQTVKDDNEAIKTELATIKTQVTEIKEDIKTKPSHQEVDEMITDKLAKIETNQSQASSAPEVISTVLSEIDQRNLRMNNIILHGLEESKAAIRETRDEHDTKLVNDILEACGVNHDDTTVTRVYRPGKYEKEKGKRPLIATLNQQSVKRELFRNAIKLRNSDHPLKDVRIGNDLTRTERERRKRNSLNNLRNYRRRIRGNTDTGSGALLGPGK